MCVGGVARKKKKTTGVLCSLPRLSQSLSLLYSSFSLEATRRRIKGSA